jgi:hypothetical protein
MLTGTSNLTGTMRSWIGTSINTAFVGVSEDNLDDYYILVIISTVMSITPLLYLWLLPNRSAIELKEASEKTEEENKDKKCSAQEADREESSSDEKAGLLELTKRSSNKETEDNKASQY